MANRTLFELYHKESISSTDIIPIQINSVDGVLNKVTVGQLMNQDNIIHVLDITFPDSEQKLEIAEIYADYISGKNLTVCIANNITIDSIVSKVYILAEFIFSDADVQTYKVYIKYNTIIDDDETITKKENSITATILKATGLVYGDIVYTTKDYATYKNTYIDSLLNGKVDDSQVLTNVPAGALFTDTIYTHPNHNGDVTSVGDGTTTISDNVVTNAKLADMIVNTIKGRKTNSTGDPEDITIAELKTMLELNNVTNVAQLAATLKGAVNGVAELDSSGKVPSSQLPAYVDDVLEHDDLLSFPLIGDTGIIYVALDTNKTYRWTGSTYTIISETLALGETSSTAYRGDRGKIAYDHSQGAHAPVGATINDTDSNLRDRTTHTGTQSASTISDFASTVRDTVLTGLSVLTNATITATDSILSALGKLQKQISDNLVTLTSHTENSSNPHNVTKTQVGLDNVTNVAQLAASLKGVPNGVAELDATGKVPSTQLPSYVDDVLEYNNTDTFPITGETGIIYVALDTNKTYRWSGSGYTIISDTIALGETSSTAYRGDRGKTAYDHSQGAHAPAGATINDTDANLRDRSNHTGTQTASTISDFTSTVRDTILTGLSMATNATITATDSILSAFGKLQKQISDNLVTLQGIVNSSKYTVTIGDNVNSVYTITHNRNTENVLVSIIKIATKENTLTAFTIVDANNITIDFGEVIGTNTYKVIVL